MKIVELLLLPENNDVLKTLTEKLNCDVDTVMGVDVLRLDVEDDLAVMMFNLLPEQSVPDEIVEHLALHATATVVITNGDIKDISPDKARRIENICAEVDGKPLLLALKSDPTSFSETNPELLNEGLFLNESGRIIPWAEQDNESIHRVWKSLFRIIGFHRN